MNRRFFLFAAPAIVAAPSLMRVSTAALPFTSDGLVAALEEFTRAYQNPLLTNEVILRLARCTLENNQVLARLRMAA